MKKQHLRYRHIADNITAQNKKLISVEDEFRLVKNDTWVRLRRYGISNSQDIHDIQSSWHDIRKKKTICYQRTFDFIKTQRCIWLLLKAITVVLHDIKYSAQQSGTSLDLEKSFCETNQVYVDLLQLMNTLNTRFM